MPLTAGSSPKVISQNIRELHGGKTYAHTAGKFGKERANRQAVAIALSNARGHWSGGVAGYDTGGGVDPVQSVISALNAGASAGGGGNAPTAPMPGATNQAAPSSPMATAATSPAPATGVAPSSVPSATAGVAAATGNPITASLLARGGVPKRAGGGFNVAQGPNLQPSWEERGAARSLRTGPVLSAVPGRTDNHQMRVPAGAYILPAAHVASIGQGNTMAGMSIASRMFGSGPYGTGLPKMGHGSLPRPPKPMTAFADGGSYSDGGARGTHQFAPTPVDLSGGEFIIDPSAIIKRWGSLKKGHAALDAWVMAARKKEIQTLRKLPPPAKK